MKLFSAEFSKINDKLQAKAVLMQKNGNVFTLLNNYITDAENIQHLSKNLPVNIGVDYYIVDETVHLPPINDSGTFKVLALNKLKESLEPGVNYLMSYKHYSHIQPDQSGNLTYKVFIAPESLFYHESTLTREQMQNINIFTISDFALCALVKRYYPGMIVFHAYSDGKKIFVTVCHDDVIVYTRNNAVSATSSDKLSVYYEYLNLTFMYATKNLRLRIDQVVLSGELAKMPELAVTFFEFSKVPQSTLVPCNVVKNCSYDMFQEYMIPISLCFLDEDYDMTPKVIIQEQARSSLKFAAGLMSVLIIFILLMLNTLSLFNLYGQSEDLSIRSMELAGNIRAYSEMAAGSENKKFELFYHNLLKDREQNVSRLFPVFADLLSVGEFSDVAFEKEADGSTSVAVGGKFTFRGLTNVEVFKNRLTEETKKITDKGYTLIDNTTYSMEKLEVNVGLKFITATQAEKTE